MPEIPPEAKALIAEFNEQEARSRAERAPKSPSKRIINRSREIRRPMTAGEISSLARSKGCIVEGGNGRHGVHIIAPNGQECALPVHGAKTLHTGTQKSILKFIEENGVSNN